jgi:hypothetical protein
VLLSDSKELLLTERITEEMAANLAARYEVLAEVLRALRSPQRKR